MKKISCLILLLAMLWPAMVLAQTELSFSPFGGRVLRVMWCNCSHNYLITIGPPRGTAYWSLPFLYSPQTTVLYQFREILRPGAWTLGIWRGSGMCVFGDRCQNRRPGLPMVMVGTSGDGEGGEPPSDGEPPDDEGEDEPPPEEEEPIAEECNTQTLAGWNFNPGIRAQIVDASPSLKRMLGCMCTKLKSQGLTGTITSISDMDFIGRPSVCAVPETRTAACDHGIGSCHYGGNRQDNKSYAADIGVRIGAGTVMSAARSCGAGTVINEGNHIHAAVAECRE